MKIAFSIDFTRPNCGKNGVTHRNLRWFYGLLGTFAEAADLVMVSNELNLGSVSYDAFLESYYTETTDSDRRDKWAQSYFNADIPVCDILSIDSDYVVVGFELSPAITRALDLKGIRYLNFRIHPVRFLQDLILSCDSNCPIFTHVLETYRRSWDDLLCEKAMIRSSYKRNRNLNPTPLHYFIAQTRFDASVIMDGHFATPDDILKRLSSDYDGQWAVIPHPYDLDNPIVTELCSHLKAELIEDQNFYEILSTAHPDSRFVTISSSGGREAQEFGFPVDFLGEGHWGKNSDIDHKQIPLSAELFTGAFWRHLLLNEAPQVPIKAPTTTIIRHSLGENWAYRAHNDNVPDQKAKKRARRSKRLKLFSGLAIALICLLPFGNAITALFSHVSKP